MPDPEVAKVWTGRTGDGNEQLAKVELAQSREVGEREVGGRCVAAVEEASNVEILDLQDFELLDGGQLVLAVQPLRVVLDPCAGDSEELVADEREGEEFVGDPVLAVAE